MQPMLTVLKPAVETALQPVGRLLKNVNPNAISLLGLLFPILFFLCVINELYALALVVFVFNAVDLLDGMVARANNKVTAFGGFLDSTIDRVADFTVIAVFGFAGIVRWNVVLPLLLLSFLISYIRSRTELAALEHGNKISGAVGLIERTERLLVVFLGLALYMFFPGFGISGWNVAEIAFLTLTILSAYTVGQRVRFAYKKL
jgi:phosphatidylglycerophosphate synthase